MNEYTIIMGAAMTAFIFINFFLKWWLLGIAALILGVGVVITLLPLLPTSLFLLAAVCVVAVGQLVALIIIKHNA